MKLDHCYVDPPPPPLRKIVKKPKLLVSKRKVNRVVAENNNNNNYVHKDKIEAKNREYENVDWNKEGIEKAQAEAKKLAEKEVVIGEKRGEACIHKVNRGE